jgi:four helix bundle protein
MQDMKARTRAFSVSIIDLYASLPNSTKAQVLGTQALRSGTSVGAHYREAQRAKSDADFISKLEGGLQEAEETAFWLEVLGDSGIVAKELLQSLLKETDELTAILVTMVKNTKARGRTRKG